MPDFNNMLAGGGIAAAIVAGWSQVKNMFQYVSSFVIVTAKLDTATSWPLRERLRYHDWTLLQGGPLQYRSEMLYIKGKSHYPLVAFRLPPNKAVYRKGWQFLFVSFQGSAGATVLFIRGTIDFDAFIKTSIELYENHNNKLESSRAQSRFCINKVMGRERYFGSEGNNASSVSSQISSSSPTELSSTEVVLNTSKDKSFMCDSSTWLVQDTDDPFESLYFPAHIQKYIEQAKQWLALGKWYTERIIPWRRGWLLYGPPGTGKSSLAKGTAQSLGIPIYQFYLSTLSDQEFMREWAQMSTPCVALLEDFDSIFNGRENITEHKSLTFDCILNQISGVSSVNGVFLIVTTNHIENIDSAMGISWEEGSGVSTRPGRIDVVIEVSNMDRVNRLKLANRILKDWPDAILDIVDANPEVTPVQFQEICIQYAYSKLSENTNA